jgi:hypothetical protein
MLRTGAVGGKRRNDFRKMEKLTKSDKIGKKLGIFTFSVSKYFPALALS